MQDESDSEDWGRLFVTRRCCGAATCRNFAPELLGEVPPSHGLRKDEGESHGPSVLAGSYEEGSFTGVLRQPRSQADLEAARAAVAACPFGAIRLQPPRSRARRDGLGSPWSSFPRRIEDHVWVLGHASQKNFGGLAYFVELEGGGVLIDTPKPSEELFRWLSEHGGVRWLFLTHCDHTYHHAEIAARFPGCRRVISAADVNLRATPHVAATGDVEIKLRESSSPMTLEGAPLSEDALAEAEFAVLPQPGHTPGSLCLLHRGRFLFTGDHLFYSHRLEHIVAARLQCWEDWERQTRSVRRLAKWAESGRLRFVWILPGHGEWHHLEGDGSSATTAAALHRGLEWMEHRPPGHVPLSLYIPFTQLRGKPNSWPARAIRAIGGEGAGDAWLLPRGARPSMPDYDPDKTASALRRAYLLAAAAGLVITAGVVGVVARARAVSALLSSRAGRSQ